MTLRRVGNIQFSKGKHKKEIGSRSNVQANTDSVKPNYSVRTQMTDKSSSENLNQRSFNIQRTASVKSNKGSRWNGIIKGVEGPVYIKPHPEENIPRLHHHLSRVLFNPGVHFLRDPRSKVYNFDPYVQRIPQPEEFNWDLIPPFIPPSNDQYLKELAEKSNAKFTGSTSSISESLSQIYFFLSSFKRLHLKDKFTSEFCLDTFTKLTRSPSSVLLIPNGNGIYSINKDNFEIPEPPKPKLGERESGNILMQLGHCLELFFTSSSSEFSKYLLCNKDKTEKPEQSDQYYVYCQYKSLLLRSQIDGMDPYLPKKTFDIKTRATAAIRMNSMFRDYFTNYRLFKLDGVYNSFIREYYDMLRSAFLKYNFQVRIGDMDGLFVAYHNTTENFGFQYISRDELSIRLFSDVELGNQVFHNSLGIMDAICQKAQKFYPNQTVRMVLSATQVTDNMPAHLDVYVEPFQKGKSEDVNKDDLEHFAVHATHFVGDIEDIANEKRVMGHRIKLTSDDSWNVKYKFIQYSKPPSLNVVENFKNIKRDLIKKMVQDDAPSLNLRSLSEFESFFSNPELNTSPEIRTIFDRIK